MSTSTSTSCADAEGLTLLRADNKAGYFGVHYKPGRPKPYQARVSRGRGKQVHLGFFSTAEEAALCVARTPEGQEAAEQAAKPPPLTSEEARQQAQADGLALLMSDNKAGYFGVYVTQPGQPKPYQAQVWRGGKDVYLGIFATAEEAALCVARSPEGRVAAGMAAAAERQGTLPAVPPELGETYVGRQLEAESRGTVPAMAPGAIVTVEALLLLLDDDLVVKEEASSDCLPKRPRTK